MTELADLGGTQRFELLEVPDVARGALGIDALGGYQMPLHGSVVLRLSSGLNLTEYVEVSARTSTSLMMVQGSRALICQREHQVARRLSSLAGVMSLVWGLWALLLWGLDAWDSLPLAVIALAHGPLCGWWAHQRLPAADIAVKQWWSMPLADWRIVLAGVDEAAPRVDSKKLISMTNRRLEVVATAVT